MSSHARSGRPPAGSFGSRRRSTPAPATRSPPSAGGCRGGGREGLRLRGSRRELSLLDLFDGRTQLIIYRFFFEPGVGTWPEGGCLGCSMLTDHVPTSRTSTPATRRSCGVAGAQDEIDALKARMGWHMPWYTLVDDFAADFDVTSGSASTCSSARTSVFRTYFVTGAAPSRSGPPGRSRHHAVRAAGGVGGHPGRSPQSPPYEWWRLHDEYGTEPGKWAETVETARPLLKEHARRGGRL